MDRNPDDPEDAGIAPELTRLKVLDVSTLQDKPVPDRDWLWPNWIPMRVASGLYADGGWGKSTWMQQLCTCSAVNKPFLGHYIQRCKSLIFECEDDTDEFHRRQATINAHLGIDFADLEAGIVHWINRVGEPNLLAVYDRRGRLEPTPLFAQLSECAMDVGAQLVAIDSSKDVYGGAENDRAQVAQFGALLTRLARNIHGAVVLLLHPSLSGRLAGTGESGSTAWEATFRSRLYGTSTPRRNRAPGEPAKDDEERIDDRLRFLTREKANYATRGEILRMRMLNGGGAFELAQTAADGNGHSMDAVVERVFLVALQELNDGNVQCSQYPNVATYAPKAVREYTKSAQGYSIQQLASALHRLMRQKRIRNVWEGPPSRRRSHLIVIDPELHLETQGG